MGLLNQFPGEQKKRMNYEKEKQIFAKAVEQDMDRLYLLVYDILKNPQDAEDALANAILKAWETRGNMKHPDLIVRHFERADVRLKQVHAVSHIYNYPWDNDQVGLAPSDNK